MALLERRHWILPILQWLGQRCVLVSAVLHHLRAQHGGFQGQTAFTNGGGPLSTDPFAARQSEASQASLIQLRVQHLPNFCHHCAPFWTKNRSQNTFMRRWHAGKMIPLCAYYARLMWRHKKRLHKRGSQPSLLITHADNAVYASAKALLLF